MKNVKFALVFLLSVLAFVQTSQAHPSDDLSYLQLGQGTRLVLLKAINFPAMQPQFRVQKVENDIRAFCVFDLQSEAARAKNGQYDLEIPAPGALTVDAVKMTYNRLGRPHSPSVNGDASAGRMFLKTAGGASLELTCARVGDGRFYQASIGEVKALLQEYIKIELAQPIQIDYGGPSIEEPEFRDI